jgi:DNA-binding NarL/FixJ family response regulator
MRATVRRRKVRIFIADGSAKVVERLTDLLKEVEGFELIGHATDGAQAAQSIQELNPDVVILGLRMTKGSGIDVLKAIRITRPGTKVIVSTNFPDTQYRKKCFDAGADFFLDKSSDFEKIPEIVLKLFDASFDERPPESAHRNAM